MEPALIVIAKAPVPGRVKTRLCPPCSPQQAARLAAAALDDTLAAVRASSAPRRIVALDGSLRVPAGFEVVAQRGAGLGERLAAAFAHAGGPAFLIGMDTPQVTPGLLDAALEACVRAGAALGPAADGGYWGIGLRAPDPAVFDGVPMSAGHTCAVQRERLAALGLTSVELTALRDVDTIADARAVARIAPHTRFAEVLAGMAPIAAAA